MWDEPIVWEWYLNLYPHHGECRTPAEPGQSPVLPALVLALARSWLGGLERIEGGQQHPDLQH